MTKAIADTVVCPITGQTVQTMYEDEEIIVHMSYGACCDCKKCFAKSGLALNSGHDSWPIVYVGAYCKKCYEKPIPRKKNGTILSSSA